MAIVHAPGQWELWDNGVMVHAMTDVTDFLLYDTIFLPSLTVRNLFYVEDHSLGPIVQQDNVGTLCDLLLCTATDTVTLGCTRHCLCHDHYNEMVSASMCVEDCPSVPDCRHPPHPDTICPFCGNGRYTECMLFCDGRSSFILACNLHAVCQECMVGMLNASRHGSCCFENAQVGLPCAHPPHPYNACPLCRQGLSHS